MTVLRMGGGRFVVMFETHGSFKDIAALESDFNQSLARHDTKTKSRRSKLRSQLTMASSSM